MIHKISELKKLNKEELMELVKKVEYKINEQHQVYIEELKNVQEVSNVQKLKYLITIKELKDRINKGVCSSIKQLPKRFFMEAEKGGYQKRLNLRKFIRQKLNMYSNQLNSIEQGRFPDIE